VNPECRSDAGLVAAIFTACSAAMGAFLLFAKARGVM
jgi:hypothetical protein